MEQLKKLKLVISYCHLDEKPHIENFIKHIDPLKTKGIIEEWYDRKVIPGTEFNEEIISNFEKADIICLFISANFLASTECKKEISRSIELQKRRFIPVVPIILSACGWQDIPEISKLLALPTDGKEVLSYPDVNAAWYNVYEGLKEICDQEMKIFNLKLKKQFEDSLQDTGMLTKAHSQKVTVMLDDIYISPLLQQYNELHELTTKISFENLLNELLLIHKMVLVGEDQSGKTTLCKKIFYNLRSRNMIPIYINDSDNQFKGKISNKIVSAFNEQYEGIELKEFNIKRIVPIIDDFHFAKDKEKHINELSDYENCVIIVDDIFCLNLRDESLIDDYDSFRILELPPTLRNDLIAKWVHLTDKQSINKNNFYAEVDKHMEKIDSTLGKIIGNGIMPSFPFFILTSIMSYEALSMSLDQEITSQGYCYQALIYLYLTKQGVKNSEVDFYFNFLTELAYHFFSSKKEMLVVDDFQAFIKYYSDKYTLPIKIETLINNLKQILIVDSFNNISFKYQYIYYFFTAKYIADHYDVKEIKDTYNFIINNLHVVENAYIAVFVVHHSKNTKMLDEIELNSMLLFEKYQPATLKKEELKFFDEQADIIIKAALPDTDHPPEVHRAQMLKAKDENEQTNTQIDKAKEPEQIDPLEMEIRRAIKTVEVVGCVVKNRLGSLEKTKIEALFTEAMNVHLRILNSFFELIRNPEQQSNIINYLSNKIKNFIKTKDKEPKKDELEKAAGNIFWNTNFFVVYGLMSRIIHSLGSDNLKEVVKNVCNKINTPASFIIKEGILMWYNKILEVDEILDKTEDKSFSIIAERVLKLLVVNHCLLHEISHQDRQKIETKLKIPKVKLLPSKKV